jgi:hypothetical protein
MKNWRTILLAFLLLVVSLACSLTVAGGASTNPSTGVSGLAPKPSGLIDKLTMAKGTQSTTLDPVNPTTVFGTNDTIHAVVHLNNAPTDTLVKAIWYAVNVGSSSENNKVIDTSDYTTAGAGNIDFSLSPTSASSWPTGTYQVEIYVNGVLDQVVDFTIK